MQIYNNLGEDNNQFVTKTTQVNKDGMHLIITKSKPVYKGNSWEINYNILSENNDFLGNIILKHSDDDSLLEAEIEYYSDLNFKNKGNITIALKAVLKDIFNNFSDINNVYLNIAPSNIASQKVAMHCGFEQRNGSRRYYEISKEKVLNQGNNDNDKNSNYDFGRNDSYFTNKFSNKINQGKETSITLENLLKNSNESLLVILLNTISDKHLIQEWLNKDPRAKYLIYKIDVNKLLQYDLIIPNDILNDDRFPNYLIKNIINHTESLIDIRSYLYKFQSINFEFYEKMLYEYKKYIQNLLDSYDYNTHLFHGYLDSNYTDRYILPNSLRKKLNEIPEKEKLSILRKETSLKISEIVVDNIFNDNIYNVRLNINEIIRYTTDINENLLDPDHLNFYKVILSIDSLSNEDKIKLYNKFKDKDISSILYDDLRILKNHSYNAIKNSLTIFNSNTGLKREDLSKTYGTDVYELNGENFYMLVKSMNPISNDINNNFINLEKKESGVERGCYSLIGSDNIDVFNRNFVYGFNNFDEQNIISVFETDCFSKENDEPILNQNYGTTAVNRLMTPSQIVNGLDSSKKTRYSEIQILGKLKPDFIVAFDSINEMAIGESKRLNIPIVIIKTMSYSNDKKSNNPFNDESLQYIDFSGDRETTLRGKR